jgi:hypothetical protein
MSKSVAEHAGLKPMPDIFECVHVFAMTLSLSFATSVQHFKVVVYHLMALCAMAGSSLGYWHSELLDASAPCLNLTSAGCDTGRVVPDMRVQHACHDNFDSIRNMQTLVQTSIPIKVNHMTYRAA